VVATTSYGAVPLAVAVGLLLTGTIGPGACGAPIAVSHPSVHGATASPTPCTVPLPPAGVRGELTVDGGPLASDADAARALNYTYALAYRTVDEENLSSTSGGCLELHAQATTEPNGSFSFVPATLPTNCTTTGGSTFCTAYSGPYAPVDVTLAGGPPVGYAESAAGWFTSIAVALVYELSSVTVAPGGPTVTTSTGAPTELTAMTWMANGTPSPLPTTFNWSVSGTGWSFTGAASGPSIDLTAVAGASVATVTVRAGASSNGTALPTVSATVDLVAVPTEIETGETNRTTVDAGGTVAVRLSALGAAGFSYSGFVLPGLDLPPVAASCTSAPAGDGMVAVTCSAPVAYPAAGTAQPTANLTNGYSIAAWTFPEIVVTPPPELGVTPVEPAGYTGTPMTITVAAANGSGAVPYARGCLEVAGASAACEAGPGPTWTFTPTFSSPGTFPATAWVVDADGTNVSISFPVEVVVPLSVGVIVPSAPNATVGAPLTLHAGAVGGVPPLRYWWNSSGQAGPLQDGDLAADRPINVTLVPTGAGPLAVTLTVVDRLGTVVSSQLLVSVSPAPAARVAVVTAPPSGGVTAGAPVALSWGAFDVSGAIDSTFAVTAEIDLSTDDGPPLAWVNASGVGPLEPLGGGAYGVPASAWVDGVLSVGVTAGTAGGVEVALSGPSLPEAPASMNLTIAPDRAHVRLFAPQVEHAGPRTNATFWHVEDRFGNAAPGALLTVGLSFGGTRDDTVVSAIAAPGGGSGVWINYSATMAGAGELTVEDGAGAVVLGPLAVPAASVAPSPNPAVDALATAVPIGAIGAAAFAVVLRRRRARTSSPAEEELRALAEGRARIVELIARSGPVDLPGLEAAWDPPPAPRALADWLASLVADGTVRATVDDDGRPRFCVGTVPAPTPRVTVDLDELDRSLRRRDEALRADEAPDRRD